MAKALATSPGRMASFLTAINAEPLLSQANARFDCRSSALSYASIASSGRLDRTTPAPFSATYRRRWDRSRWPCRTRSTLRHFYQASSACGPSRAMRLQTSGRSISRVLSYDAKASSYRCRSNSNLLLPAQACELSSRAGCGDRLTAGRAVRHFGPATTAAKLASAAANSHQGESYGHHEKARSTTLRSAV